MRLHYLITAIASFSLGNRASAFAPSHHHLSRPQHSLAASVVPNEKDLQTSYVLSEEEVNPLIRLGTGEKEKVINSFGLWCAAVSLVTGPLWMGAMSLVNLMYKLNEDWDPHRAIYDQTGKIWAKTWLSLTNSFPTFSGQVDQLQQGQGPCLYVANHASWLDIPVLCTLLDPVFKFIAKGELTKVPCIGQQLSGGSHILIDRDDRRSQLRTFKDGIGWLKKGVPIMAFPEGMRSRDGRLMEFKGGLFLMAVKANVPIVPITVSHTHAVMPSNSLFPVQSGGGKLHIHVHEPIDTTDKTEAQLEELVRESFVSTLPVDQHPLDAASDVQIEMLEKAEEEASPILKAAMKHHAIAIKEKKKEEVLASIR